MAIEIMRNDLRLKSARLKLLATKKEYNAL